MTEMPEDIMKAARRYVNAAEPPHTWTRVIARAVLAERERCAARLETISHSGMNESWWRRKFQVAADVLRSGK